MTRDGALLRTVIDESPDIILLKDWDGRFLLGNTALALGFELDESANLVRSKEPRDISTPESKVRVLVIPTNEELAMAEETLEVIGAEF